MNIRFDGKAVKEVIKFFISSIIFLYVPLFVFYILIDFEIIYVNATVQAIIEVAWYLLGIFLLWALYKRNLLVLKYIALKKEKSKIITYVIVAALFFVYFFMEIIYLPVTPNHEELTKVQMIALYLGTMFFAPIVEEIIFRGIIFERLLKKNSMVLSILITSTFFAILHYEPKRIIGSFIFSIIICVLYYDSRNVILAVWGHFVFNFSVWILALFQEAGILSVTQDYKLILSPFFLIIVHISFILLIGSYVFIEKK